MESTKKKKKNLECYLILLRRRAHALKWGLCNFFFVDFRDFIFENFMDKKIQDFY
jgi:hypothetical protein